MHASTSTVYQWLHAEGSSFSVPAAARTRGLKMIQCVNLWLSVVLSVAMPEGIVQQEALPTAKGLACVCAQFTQHEAMIHEVVYLHGVALYRFL